MSAPPLDLPHWPQQAPPMCHPVPFLPLNFFNTNSFPVKF